MTYKNPLDPRARESRRKHYYKNKARYLLNNTRKREAMRKYLIQAKNKPCIDCGVQYPYYVMDFDHRNRTTKIFKVSQIINNGSWRNFLEEIEKCDVICANCHRERTQKYLTTR